MQDLNAYSERVTLGIIGPRHGDGDRCECQVGSDDGICSQRYPCENTNCQPLKKRGCGPFWSNYCDGECGHPER